MPAERVGAAPEGQAEAGAPGPDAGPAPQELRPVSTMSRRPPDSDLRTECALPASEDAASVADQPQAGQPAAAREVVDMGRGVLPGGHIASMTAAGWIGMVHSRPGGTAMSCPCTSASNDG